jgi:hypothetical protein
MITWIVIVLALLAVGLFYLSARSRRKQSRQQVRPVDIKAFRTLMDRDDELFLKERLSPSGFAHIKRQRVNVSMRYVGRIANNASIVMRMSEGARSNPDPEIAKAATQIMEVATQLRLQCIVALAKLSIEFALPSLQLTPAVLVPQYQKLRESVTRLGRLQAQTAPGPVAVAI